MSFTGIEFTDDSGGGVALVSSQWLTPRKQEVFWPPYKFQSQYDYSKAQSKIKQAQITSDCQSEIDDILPLRRIIRKPKRLAQDDDSSDDEDNALSEKNKFPPPPKIVALNDKANEKQLLPSLSQTLKSVHQIATPGTSNSCNSDPPILYSNISSDSEHSVRSSLNNVPTTSTVVETNFQDRFHCHGIVIKKIFSLLVDIKEQNNKILSLLNEKQVTSNTLAHNQFRLQDLPVNLPLSTQADLDILETYLKNSQNVSTMCSYLATLGGRDITSKTNRILKYLLTDKVASNYSFYGKRMNKSPFSSLKCCSVVLQSVKSTSSHTEKEIEDVIKVWLKHAPQRIKIRNITNKTTEHD
ncbi:hypothetical protein DMN91_004091 [Ooceraea biroi]|uniref:DUF4806 domain-containing protein n=1 Tax=Ooceraea biroi TaxID=2015173 RepID=A0A3L8DUN3_OOCBI|nr:hypothetical protein DMN91_004091 [Ooceraea biroi]